MHWPSIRDLAASAGVRLRDNNTQISAALRDHKARKGLHGLLLLLPTHVLSKVTGS